MLQLKKRLRYSGPGLAVARVLSSGGPGNPVVFLDIEADSEPLGRITIEVAKWLTLATAVCTVKDSVWTFIHCQCV